MVFVIIPLVIVKKPPHTLKVNREEKYNPITALRHIKLSGMGNWQYMLMVFYFV